MSGGRMVLWRDGAAGEEVDFEIAIEPPSAAGPTVKADRASDAIPSSATDACGAAQQASTAVATGEGEPPLATFDVEARDLWFSPTELTVSGSGHLTIRLENTGRVAHNLTVDELGIVIVVTAGGTGEAVLTDVEPGTYAFYCSISGHREAGMEGTLTIQ